MTNFMKRGANVNMHQLDLGCCGGVKVFEYCSYFGHPVHDDVVQQSGCSEVLLLLQHFGNFSFLLEQKSFVHIAMELELAGDRWQTMGRSSTCSSRTLTQDTLLHAIFSSCFFWTIPSVLLPLLYHFLSPLPSYP